MEISPTEMQSTGDFRENLDRLRYIRSFLRFFVHETIIIVGDEKKGKSVSSLFREENFQAEFFINYNIISPWIEYANSTVIECIFNFQKWSRKRKMINLEFRRMFHCIDFIYFFLISINMLIKSPYYATS